MDFLYKTKHWLMRNKTILKFLLEERSFVCKHKAQKQGKNWEDKGSGTGMRRILGTCRKWGCSVSGFSFSIRNGYFGLRHHKHIHGDHSSLPKKFYDLASFSIEKIILHYIRSSGQAGGCVPYGWYAHCSLREHEKTSTGLLTGHFLLDPGINIIHRSSPQMP